MNIVKRRNVVKKLQEDSIFSGALSLTFSTLVVKFLGLIYKLPLAGILGDEGMGYFNSAYTIYAFFYLLCTAGVPKAIMILISDAKARDNSNLAREIVTVAFRMFITIGIILTILFTIMSAPFAKLIGSRNSAYTMIAIAPTILIASISGVIRGLLSASMMLSDIAISGVIEGVGKLGFGLVFAMLADRQNLPLHIISAMTIFGITIGSLLGLIYLFIRYKTKISNEKAGQSERFDKKQIRKSILSISVPITISAAILSISGVIDLGLIMRSLESIGYTEIESSALYGNYTTLAVPMFNLALSLISPISTATLPAITTAYAKKDKALMAETEKNAIDMTSLIAAPIVVGLLIFSKEILTMLFKNSNIDIGAPLLIILTPAIIFSSLLMMINSILESYGYVKAPMISMLFGGVAKIFASYILIRNSNFGIKGAPLGTVISYCIALIVSLIIYSKKTNCSINLIRPFIHFYLPSFVIIVFAKLLYKALFVHFGLVFSLILSIVLVGILYSFYILITVKSNKSKVLNLAKYTKKR